MRLTVVLNPYGVDAYIFLSVSFGPLEMARSGSPSPCCTSTDTSWVKLKAFPGAGVGVGVDPVVVIAAPLTLAENGCIEAPTAAVPSASTSITYWVPGFTFGSVTVVPLGAQL